MIRSSLERILQMPDNVRSSSKLRRIRAPDAEDERFTAQFQPGRHLSERELDLAVRIHESLLPRSFQHAKIDVAVRYLPVSGLGGDYCQVIFPNESTCCISICDVTGHGTGPALLATRVSSEVRRLTFENHPPREIVRLLNAFLVNHFSDGGLQVSFFAARVELDRRRMAYSGGGHPGPFLIRCNGSRRVEVLRSQNMLLGLTEQCMSGEPEHSVTVESGDRLLLYTDGITEAETTDSRILGENGLLDIVRCLTLGNVLEVVDQISERVAQQRSGPPRDDMTLLVLELK